VSYKTIIVRFALCSLALLIISGCGEDFLILNETLEIDEISAGQSSIDTGGTTTLDAAVSYSGDETVLLYDWSADAGEISGSGSRDVYKAPNTPGVYTIEVTVTDGVVSSGATIAITVGQQSVGSLILDINTYWPADELEGKLVYSVDIEKIESGRVTLHYDITQDQDEFDAFLRIQINQQTVLPSTAIGGELPSTAKRTVDDVDVSSVIRSPGRYTITFYIKPANRANRGWLLNEARITGVQGTSDPQQ
jgi:hypothetical protein